MNEETKSAVSCSEMARMVGLSRQRFHQLVKDGIFPHPLYDVETRRPFYSEDMQQVCLDVRKRNMGINGKAILFYAPRNITKPVSKKKVQPHTDLIEGIRLLGMPNVTTAQVESAIKTLYPQGTANIDQSEVLRAVFLHIKRQESSKKAGPS